MIQPAAGPGRDRVRYAEELRVGEVTSLGSFTLSRAELVSFAQRWDPQAFHVDEAAAAAGRFGDVIASGVQTLGIFQRLCVLCPDLNWAVIAGAGLEVRFLRPVFAGTPLTGGVRVESVDIDDRRRRATVRKSGWLDDGGGRVFEARLEELIRCRPAPGDGERSAS